MTEKKQNVLQDIVDDIDIKPNRTKLLLKWVIGISSTLITGAFIFGQLKMSHLNRLDGIEDSLNEQKTQVEEFRQEYRQGQEQLNSRIDKVYDDATKSFEAFQESNQKQLELIIDYGDENKEMLKRMLEINALERQQKIENQLEQAKNETVYGGEIEAIPIEERKAKNCENEMFMVEKRTGDTLFIATGANQLYLNNIRNKNYKIESIDTNPKNPDLFDIRYRNR